MNMPSNEEIRGFAREENNYILNLLFKPPVYKGEEMQVLKLSVRNTEATANSFGESDLLHIMALNTLGFVYFKKESDSIKALEIFSKATELCKVNNLEKEELFWETISLTVYVKIKSGASPTVAILEHFAGENKPGSINEIQESTRVLNEQLTKAVFGVNIKEILLTIALKEISVALIQFVQEKDKTAAETIYHCLSLFMKTYYLNSAIEFNENLKNHCICWLYSIFNKVKHSLFE